MRSPRLAAIALSTLFAACGGDSDGGGNGDGGPGDCGFASDSYLPYEVGYTWTYRLTDLGTGERATKEQRLDPEMEHPDYGTVIVQVTGKINGDTVSLVRKEGDRVLRFEQEDRDPAGALERTTTYDPAQIRIDESPDRIVLGATWEEAYTEVITDPNDVVLMSIETVDEWEVLGVDDPCESPMGTFECIRLRRTRTAGGVAEKEFHFARGIGKVREIGSNQLEELTDCGAE